MRHKIGIILYQKIILMLCHIILKMKKLIIMIKLHKKQKEVPMKIIKNKLRCHQQLKENVVKIKYLPLTQIRLDKLLQKNRNLQHQARVHKKMYKIKMNYLKSNVKKVILCQALLNKLDSFMNFSEKIKV